MAPVTKTKTPSQGRARSSSSQTGTKRVKGENFYRDAKKAARVKMLNSGKPVYGRDGKIVEAAAFQKTEADAKPGRVQLDRRWFGALLPSSKSLLLNKIYRKHEGHLSNSPRAFSRKPWLKSA